MFFYCNIEFEFNRFVVRLGAHDLRTDDGQHVDVLIDRAVPHASYSELFGVNDIAMIYLEHDIEFNGSPVTHSTIDFHFQIVLIFAHLYGNRSNSSHLFADDK